MSRLTAVIRPSDRSLDGARAGAPRSSPPLDATTADSGEAASETERDTPALRVELGETLMRAIARRHDVHPYARGRDNFLVFSSELEVYSKANHTLHICTVCPHGDPDGCFDKKMETEAFSTYVSVGLKRHWG